MLADNGRNNKVYFLIREKSIDKLAAGSERNKEIHMRSISTVQDMEIAGDVVYPKGMSRLENMPSLLYYKGNIEVINKCKNIAVIGSRKLSEVGKRLSYYTGEAVAKEGLNLVNGLALGCDTEAIKGALAVGAGV